MKSFRNALPKPLPPLYFAKVDVKAAFDTIPQSAVVKLIASLTTEDDYLIRKHVEIRRGDTLKPTRKFTSLAQPQSQHNPFPAHLSSKLVQSKKQTVFVDRVVPLRRSRAELLHLLRQHVEQNMVRIGKRFYRQKSGIPQGSVLSSLLCNYFYADLEATHLAFLHEGGVGQANSVLLRLIDDFLLVTTDKEHARRFLEVMHAGLPDYGVVVGEGKTLVNFEARVGERKVSRLVGGMFPYCGTLIDVQTLNISKDTERNKGSGMFKPVCRDLF